MIVLDASVLIAHLNPYATHHERASALLAEASSDRLVSHRLTLAEILVGGARVGRVREMLADLREIGLEAHPEVSVDDEVLELAELRATTGLKLPDCCVLNVALEHNASLATFDRTLADAARGRGVVVLPADGQ